MVRVLLGLGSNLGRRSVTLSDAWRAISQTPGIRPAVLSRFYQTEPVGGPPQPDFLNAAAVIETLLPPEALLDRLAEIEQRFGRKRSVHWGPRTLDLDILLYGDQTVRTERLTIPHPLFDRRRFALEPAAQIAPNWRHPVLNRTVAELLDELTSCDVS